MRSRFPAISFLARLLVMAQLVTGGVRIHQSKYGEILDDGMHVACDSDR